MDTGLLIALIAGGALLLLYLYNEYEDQSKGGSSGGSDDIKPTNQIHKDLLKEVEYFDSPPDDSGLGWGIGPLSKWIVSKFKDDSRGVVIHLEETNETYDDNPGKHSGKRIGANTLSDIQNATITDPKTRKDYPYVVLNVNKKYVSGTWQKSQHKSTWADTAKWIADLFIKEQKDQDNYRYDPSTQSIIYIGDESPTEYVQAFDMKSLQRLK